MLSSALAMFLMIPNSQFFCKSYPSTFSSFVQQGKQAFFHFSEGTLLCLHRSKWKPESKFWSSVFEHMLQILASLSILKARFCKAKLSLIFSLQQFWKQPCFPTFGKCVFWKRLIILILYSVIIATGYESLTESQELVKSQGEAIAAGQG